MLRMTRKESGSLTTLFIEGKIFSPWVPEIRAALEIIPDGHSRRIDLGGVTFVDRAGAELLESLRSDGVEIASCTPFVADLMEHYARNRLR